MANPVSYSELERALDNLVLAEIIPHVEENDITISKIAERYNLEHRQAKTVVKSLVASGKLEFVGKRRLRSNGRIVDVWKMIEKG